ncbi:hypothetical protein J6590_091721 [Homalodisca vitripennis]|nr:hypothetical protein J6590_091721 [Homalodisca vitripennis]
MIALENLCEGVFTALSLSLSRSLSLPLSLYLSLSPPHSPFLSLSPRPLTHPLSLPLPLECDSYPSPITTFLW